MLTVIQTLPALDVGGVERGTVEVAAGLAARGHRSIVISAGGRLVRELTAAGSEHITLPIGRKSPLTLGLVWHLRRLIRQSGAHILHTRSRLPAWITYLAWRGLPAARPRFITTMHGPYSVNPYSRIMTLGERIIAVSEYMREYIIGNYPGVDPDRIVTIPRGVDPAVYPYGYRPDPAWLREWHSRRPDLDGRYLITLPGRITRRKGLEDFIDILAILVGAGLPVHGLVAGGADRRHQPFLRQVEEKIRINGLLDRISLLGHRNDLREVMSISDLVLVLSKQPESFGRTALESLNLGVPVIAYNRGGSVEILASIFPRGLTTADDPGRTAALIQEFMAERPRVSADTNPYTLERMLGRTIRLYEDLAPARAGA